MTPGDVADGARCGRIRDVGERGRGRSVDVEERSDAVARRVVVGVRVRSGHPEGVVEGARRGRPEDVAEVLANFSRLAQTGKSRE